MTLLGRLAVISTVATGMAMAFVVLDAPPAGAEIDVDVSEVCSAPADGSTMRIDLLVLLDVSGSLRSNDPDNLRISGTKDAIVAFDDLSGRFDNADVRVAIDNFETDYSREQGWTAVAGASTTLLPRIDSIGAIPAGQTTTDYTEALAGAWERLAEQDADCRLLVWFTDGEHLTVAPADEVVAEEWAELGDLCDSRSMQSLRDSTWVGAVRLVADDSSGETLRYLFGETGRVCANPLRGEIYDDFDPTDLGLVLHDIIAGAAEDVQYTEDQDKLPGEPDDPPTDDEYETCEGGTGTGSREQPCTYTFRLDASHESFRAFVDLTFIGQGVRNADLVHTVLRSPPGTSGTVASPTIGGSGEVDPAEADGAYLPVLPFWFYTRAQYGSEIQIVGHQAAEQLTNPNQWQWQWEGEWALLFFGDTPAAQADARSVATAVRVQRDASPFIDSFGIDDQCSVSGFVASYPSEEYPNVELQLRVDAGDGKPVYPTRASLTGVPLEVDAGSRRFAVERVFAELVAWDSPEEGGNGTNLRNALTQRDGIDLVAVLSQTFQYAGAREPLVWTRDIGRLELTPQQASHLLGSIDGRGADPLLCLPLDPGVRWLPTDVTLGDPQHDWGGASLDVSADRGVLPATLSLVAGGVGPVEDSGTDAAALPGVQIDNAEWTCEVPAAAAGSSRFTCPEPITIEVGTDEPLRPAIQLRIPLAITESPGSPAGLLERLGYEADSAGYGVRSQALADALGRERRAETFEAELPAIVDPGAIWRPSDFQLATVPRDAIDIESVLVSVSPGELPASVRLESLTLISESEDVSRDVSSTGAAQWVCEVPGSVSDGGRFACADPITVDLPLERDAEMQLVARLCFTQEPAAVNEVLERLGVSGAAGGFETLGLIEGDCVEPPHVTVPPTPPTPGSILAKFLPMLAVLVAVAAAARVLIAWRLRPWQPLSSPDYAVVLLDRADTDGVPIPAPDPSRICMDLQQRKSATSFEGLRLRSLWMPLLRSGAPQLRASSVSGNCIGPAGYRRHRRHGHVEAVVGPDLVRGWIVHDTGHDPRLIVWDLPFDDDDTRRARIIDAERDAALAWERYRAAAPSADPTPGDSMIDSAESEPAARHLSESDPALQDPFAEDSSDLSGDNRPDLDDADPFGRDS